MDSSHKKPVYNLKSEQFRTALPGTVYNLIVATDGMEALEKARSFEGQIDLLLSDVEMPGMTGIELAIQLNRARPTTRILLISGLQSGMLVLNNGWQFLPKPFVADMLRDRIRDFLAEQPPIEDHILGSLPKPGSSETS